MLIVMILSCTIYYYLVNESHTRGNNNSRQTRFPKDRLPNSFDRPAVVTAKSAYYLNNKYTLTQSIQLIVVWQCGNSSSRSSGGTGSFSSSFSSSNSSSSSLIKRVSKNSCKQANLLLTLNTTYHVEQAQWSLD